MRRRDFAIVLLGASALCARRALTQQRTIGFLSAGSADAYASFAAAFRWAEGHYDRLAELANDLLRKPV